MVDSLLPAAGWYADGATVGVRRWFDGTDWTEHTMPEPGAVAVATRLPTPHAPLDAQPPWLADARFSSEAAEPTFGASVPSRQGLSISPADMLAREAAFEQHRLGEARRVRRGATGAFCSGLALLAVTSGISLGLGPDELWGAGALGAGYLVWRGLRDHGRATFRGAPRLPFVARLAGLVALVAALGLFVAVPIKAAHQAQHAVDDLGGLTSLTGGVPTDGPLPDGTLPDGSLPEGLLPDGSLPTG